MLEEIYLMNSAKIAEDHVSGDHEILGESQVHKVCHKISNNFIFLNVKLFSYKS